MSEIRVLLLTDLIDSTRLAEQLGDARAAEIGEAHDRVARDLLGPHRGREIDKTDGFLLLFSEAADAVAYALAYHEGLKGLGLQARAGLHAGSVILRENAAADVALGAKPLEVEGVAKAVAARVMSVAIGGQTLATAEAVSALDLGRMAPAPDGSGSGEGLVALSHGFWQLKGLALPLELFELGVAGVAPLKPPPDAMKAWRVVFRNDAWIPVREVPHGLAAARDAFVGREADLQDLARLLDDGARLVSVVGLGGCGKTRLVTQHAWTWLGDYPGGAWFVDLSEARGIDGVVGAVAAALGVPLGKQDPVTQLGHAIAGRGRCLVVLDNFEQVAAFAPDALERWLDRAAEARFVVTSRQVLGIAGEQVLALEPLDEAAAIELFRARAISAKRDFVLSGADHAVVVDLVRLLDGLPLAIELAAARVRVMPPKILLQRMSERFKLLASPGGRHARHATLRATLDWSWELLSADEQAALAQLAVFEGGFTLEAAEAVLALSETWPMDAVQALVDKSLVRAATDERFELLVTVHDYATERLVASGARAGAEARHGQHYARCGAEEALEALDRHGGVERRRTLSSELDNLVAATRRAVLRGDGAVAAGALRASWAVLGMRGPYAVGVELATAVLGVPDLPPRARSEVSRVAAAALTASGRGTEAPAHYERALSLVRELGRRRDEGVVLARLGNLDAEQGRTDEARARYGEALALAIQTGDRGLEGAVLGTLGTLNAQQGRTEEAQAQLERALAVHREVGSRDAEGLVLCNLGNVHAERGEIEEARARYEDAVVVHREVGNRRSESLELVNLGVLHQDEGRLDDALEHFERALAVAREVGDRGLEGLTLGNLGVLYRSQGRSDDARAQFEQALVLAREAHSVRLEGILLGKLGEVYGALGRLDEARAALDVGAALLRSVDDPVELGLLLEVRAALP